MPGRTDCGRPKNPSTESRNRHSNRIPRLCPRIPTMLISFPFAGLLIFPVPCRAQVDYVARFTLEKQKFIVGEPIFCNFVIKNRGARALAFRYRSPDRSLNTSLENEPHFKVTGANHRAVADPAPHHCGGAKGSTVYGSVSLPPGQTHTERWR